MLADEVIDETYGVAVQFDEEEEVRSCPSESKMDLPTVLQYIASNMN